MNLERMEGMADNIDAGFAKAGGESGRMKFNDKTRAVSAAVGRAVAKYKRQLEEMQAKNAEAERLLEEAGLPPDILLAAAQVISAARQLNGEGGMNSERFRRDQAILGRADADAFTEVSEMEAEIERLLKKPVRLRTFRDRACFERLCDCKARLEGRAELENIGVDFDALYADEEFCEFMQNLDQGLSPAKKYELFTKYCAKEKDFAAPGGGVSVPEVGEDFFSPEQVRRMDREQVKKNLGKINASMGIWGKKFK